MERRLGRDGKIGLEVVKGFREKVRVPRRETLNEFDGHDVLLTGGMYGRTDKFAPGKKTGWG